MLDESQFGLIRDKKTAKDTWAALKAHHEEITLGQRVTLLRQITNQNFKIGDNMEIYLADIEKQYGRLESSGFEMEECLKVALILRGLPESFNPLTTALEARNENELTLELVKVKLLDEVDKHRRRLGSTSKRCGCADPARCRKVLSAIIAVNRGIGSGIARRSWRKASIRPDISTADGKVRRALVIVKSSAWTVAMKKCPLR
ncbi:uncharacterized protein LOC129765049 isoform X2 [Toxorhynchites rutilus septentrionalis]|uniref:uncharacterized protein LOC129765049 isoform X2 n=1 Tax=Toxorhynchites rutilus septentrionalis TaxID=329112 RepID=UPI00247A40D2|nr:uncharacterized protein LOC129765049 isoform X2 [Toxorhynchites rutilus septentrionalis]